MNKVKQLVQEIENIQNTCLHKNFKICNYSWRIGGQIEPKRKCTDCDLILHDMLTEEEYNSWECATIKPLYEDMYRRRKAKEEPK